MSRPARRVRFEPHDQRPHNQRADGYDAPRYDPSQHERRSRGARQGEPRFDTAGFFTPGGQQPTGYGQQAGHGQQTGRGAPPGYGPPAGYRGGPRGGAAPHPNDAATHPNDAGRFDRTPFDRTAQYHDATTYGVPTRGNGGWDSDATTVLNGARFDPSGPRGRRPRTRRHGIRRLWRLRTVKVATALVALFAVGVSISVGQALANPNGGTMSSKLAEWARDHYLGPVVTFGEWLTYKPPPVGGKPSFSLTQGESTKTTFKHVHGFTPIIPKNLTSPAGSPQPGEGVWRLTESVKGQPAMFTTFLRNDAVHTSEVSGLVSMDQRLLKFSLHPGSEDPGPGNWGTQSYIPAGSRKGLMATFNGGFKLNVSGGGFYLNGITRGSLTNGAASLVYYKNGTVKIGDWGRDVRMTSSVTGVRQNLKLIVDHGSIPAAVNKNVLSNWGATLGGAYYVWRSGIGITKDGRVIYVYGPALSVQTLAGLLQRAGAVEAMQMDINPFWTTFESYHGKTTDPTPRMLLPSQQTSAYRYYSVWSRDFTSVYSR